MNEEYFKAKLDEIFDLEGEENSPDKVVKILKRIARDAFQAGADAKGIADRTAMNKLDIFMITVNENISGCGMLMVDVYAAIQSATVEFLE